MYRFNITVVNIYLGSLILILILIACSKESGYSIPTISTIQVSSISQHSAVSGGEIISDGGSKIIAKGVCWSEQQSPTISDKKTDNGQSPDYFISILEGLESNKSYYLRAYATNTIGTGYGNVVTFFTTIEVLPTVTTEAVSEISYGTAVCGGNVSDDGGSEIVEKGVCYDIEHDPKITDIKITNSSGLGEFTSSLSNLNVNTTYYVRAYATNSIGTSYGDEKMFKTLYIAEDVDGNIYTTISLNNEVWFKENLKVTRYRNGTEIELVTDIDDWMYTGTPAYCWYENNKELYGDTYGALYNYQAVHPDSLCPIGWHVPSFEKFLTLIIVYNNGELKEANYEHWRQPNTAATNSSGFTGLPGGQRGNDYFGNNGFSSLGYNGYWWSLDSEDWGGHVINLHYNSKSGSSDFIGAFHGCSVRCVKD